MLSLQTSALHSAQDNYELSDRPALMRPNLIENDEQACTKLQLTSLEALDTTP